MEYVSVILGVLLVMIFVSNGLKSAKIMELEEVIEINQADKDEVFELSSQLARSRDREVRERAKTEVVNRALENVKKSHQEQIVGIYETVYYDKASDQIVEFKNLVKLGKIDD